MDVANLRVINIGTIVTGDIDAPLAEGDTVVVRGARLPMSGMRRERRRRSKARRRSTPVARR